MVKARFPEDTDHVTIKEAGIIVWELCFVITARNDEVTKSHLTGAAAHRQGDPKAAILKFAAGGAHAVCSSKALVESEIGSPPQILLLNFDPTTSALGGSGRGLCPGRLSL